MFGLLELSGIGAPTGCAVAANEDDLRDGCTSSNEMLLGQLSEDPHGEELLRLTHADAKLGRMSAPVPGAVADGHLCCGQCVLRGGSFRM